MQKSDKKCTISSSILLNHMGLACLANKFLINAQISLGFTYNM